jgi:hypothetical protein
VGQALGNDCPTQPTVKQILVGTSRAFSFHPEAGAYASLGIGFHGILGVALIPYAVAWWF